VLTTGYHQYYWVNKIDNFLSGLSNGAVNASATRMLAQAVKYPR
jgi:hypothetical protein